MQHTIPIPSSYVPTIGLHDSLYITIEYDKHVGAPGGSFRPPRQEPRQSPSLRQPLQTLQTLPASDSHGLHVALDLAAECFFKEEKRGKAYTVTSFISIL